MNSPTIFDQASITSVSRKRSRSPKRCISLGITSAGDCQRSGRIFLSGRPRHSAMTAARREGFTKNYLATDAVLSNAEAWTPLEHGFQNVVEALVPSAGFFGRRLTQPPLQPQSPQYFRRMWLGRIFSSPRYFATVRRAIGMPRSPRISTIS
jgi:hypothetical protein